MKHSGIPADQWNSRVQVQIAAQMAQDAARRAGKGPGGILPLPEEQKPATATRHGKARLVESHEDTHPHGSLPHSQPERDQAPALGITVQREAESLSRTTVRFVGFRVRPLDPDSFAGSVKDLLDGLRHAALISGDEPWRIRLETEQVRVATFAEERTEITLTFP